MKIIQHANCFEVRSDHGTFVRRFPFDDNARRRTTSKRMSRKQAFQAAKNFAGKPADSMLMIDAAIHDAVMALPPDERRDRAKVNVAVREGLRLGPLRPAGSADLYDVPKATE